MPPKKKTITQTIEKSKGLFDHIDAIYMNQHPDYFDTLSDADKKSYSVYMVNRFLSMNPNQLPLVNEIQKYSLPADMHYSFFSKMLPKRKQFNKYIKSKKETKYDTWLVELVAKHFEVSTDEALEYVEIYYKHDKPALRQLCEAYGINNKILQKAKL